MKIILLFITVLIIPYHLKAQNKTGQKNSNEEFRPGILKKDLRANYRGQPQYYKTLFETDTLDSYMFQSMIRINCFYKNDTCYKMQMIAPFDHNQIKNMAPNSNYKKTGENTWVHSDGTVEIKMTFDTLKDISTVEASLVGNKSQN